MHHADEFGALVEELLVLVDQQFAGIVDRHDADLRALLFGQHLPRHDVRVVLERGQDDFVAGADELAAIAVHHEVDRVRGAAGEDHFAVFARVDEALQLAPRFLVFGGRGFGQIMHPAMNVGVLRRLVAHQAVDHRLRHLAGRRVVEIDQRLAADFELQDRKIGADALHIQCAGNGCRHRISAGRSPLPPGSGARGEGAGNVTHLRHGWMLVCSSTACSRRCLSVATGIRSMISAPNA